MATMRHCRQQYPDLVGCEFCDELVGRPSTFSRLYSGVLSDRVVARAGSFVAFPTIGQIYPRYLLIVPEDHVENLAGLVPERMSELARFVEQLTERVAAGSPWVAFEHGAAQATGGGCGIYHAHLHLVPLPRPIGIGEALPRITHRFPTLAAALVASRAVPEYLLFGTAEGYATLDISSNRQDFPSQYFRQLLVTALDASGPWDWRAMSHPEQALVDTVAMFRG